MSVPSVVGCEGLSWRESISQGSDKVGHHLDRVCEYTILLYRSVSNFVLEAVVTIIGFFENYRGLGLNESEREFIFFRRKPICDSKKRKWGRRQLRDPCYYRVLIFCFARPPPATHFRNSRPPFLAPSHIRAATDQIRE